MNATWQTIAIKDLGRVVTGRTPSCNNPGYFGSVYPFITPSDIALDNRHIETERHVSEEGKESLERILLPKGAVCFVCIGATIGKICMTSRPSFTNQQINSVIVDDAKHDSRFAFYALSTQGGNAKALAGGAATPIINKSAFSEIEIDVPDLPTQRKIAGILSAYDDLIENNLRRIKILEQMAQSLYREWFVHFRFPGHESVKFIDSSLGQIPKGWKVKTLDELTEVILDCRGKTPKKLGGDWSDEGIIALSALNVKTGHLIKMDQAKTLSDELYSKWMKTPLKRHDVLLTSEAPLGECYLLPDDTPYCLSQRLFALRSDPEMISPALLFYSLISQQGQARLQNRATGTTVRGIRQAALREVEILVPDQKIRELAGAFFEGTAAQLANLHRRNQTLRRTRDLLLPKLLSGGDHFMELETASSPT